MSKSTFDFDPKQLDAVKAQFALESIGVQLETFDWVRSLQWAIKAIASESDGLERIKLERIQHLAAASVYLTSEALEALRDDTASSGLDTRFIVGWACQLAQELANDVDLLDLSQCRAMGEAKGGANE